MKRKINGTYFLYGLQHVLAMYAGAVTVPILFASALHLSMRDMIYLINADLFACSLATCLQVVGFRKPFAVGVRLPLMQGVSFASIPPMLLIGRDYGIPTVYGSVIMAGLISSLMAPQIRRYLHLFPPLVTATITTMIGLTLLPVAFHWIEKSYLVYHNEALLLSGATFFFTLLLLRGPIVFLSKISILLGLIFGTLLGLFMGVVDFDLVSKVPLLGMTRPFHFGFPEFEFVPILMMTLVMIVIMVETLGNMMAVKEITGKKVSPKDLSAGLVADGLSTLLGGILNSFPYTAYAQNVGLVAISKVKDESILIYSAAILFVLGFFPKFGAIMASVPSAVLGGGGLIMFSMVALSGLKTLMKIKNKSYGFYVTVFGSLFFSFLPRFLHLSSFPQWAQIILHSGLTLGSLAAICLNLLTGNMNKSLVDIPINE